MVQTKQLEREKILEVAQEYRQKGYEVILSPNHEQLPTFLQNYGYSPDMIALRGEQGVIVEVKSRRSFRLSANNIQTLAQLVEQAPNWGFDLVITNPDDELYTDQIEGSLQIDEIKSRLQIAKQLINNHPESAILFIWSLAEATLRILAESEGLILQKPESPPYLLKLLVTEGVISQTDYQLLINNLQLRNAIAHGFKTNSLSLNSVIEVIEVIEKLLDSLNCVSSTIDSI
ncbi:hypothetical protein WJM97_10520 [Okeanomitos corallinicola TIOX110]|uniref:REase AHJR-like domain-containing protein n=1 Tax=Okeanomitos corallinicola TIOX110 TaxID=3133117 RepID=A0ABZ2UYE5_9CYAN